MRKVTARWSQMSGSVEWSGVEYRGDCLYRASHRITSSDAHTMVLHLTPTTLSRHLRLSSRFWKSYAVPFNTGSLLLYSLFSIPQISPYILSPAEPTLS